jgi:hypothetical protein
MFYQEHLFSYGNTLDIWRFAIYNDFVAILASGFAEKTDGLLDLQLSCKEVRG